MCRPVENKLQLSTRSVTFVGFEVLIVVTMKNMVWVITPYSLEGAQCFVCQHSLVLDFNIRVKTHNVQADL
jgi:hypothetical protein